MTLNINQFGVSVIYLLLSAKGISEVVVAFAVDEKGAPYDFSKCYVMLILAILLLPFTFLKSPVDFWWSIFGAMVCSILAAVFIIVGAGMDYKECHSFDRQQSIPTGLSIFSALGNMVFAFDKYFCWRFKCIFRWSQFVFNNSAW